MVQATYVFLQLIELIARIRWYGMVRFVGYQLLGKQSSQLMQCTWCSNAGAANTASRAHVLGTGARYAI